MPSKIDPSSIVTGAGPSESRDNETQLSTQVDRQQDAYSASQISALNSSGLYSGDDSQSHFDDLAGAIPTPPPTIGQAGGGFPDWGALRQDDSDNWLRRSSLAGITSDNGSGVFVTIDPEIIAYKGASYTAVGSNIFPYYRSTLPIGTAGDGSDTNTDPIFNIIYNNTGHQMPGDIGASHIAHLFDGGGNLKFIRALKDKSSLYQFNGDGSVNKGFTLSGFLYPADRGTLALIRWDNDASNLLSAATSVADVMNRVVAAVNLGQGVGPNDGEAGGELFIEDNGGSFPSRNMGQFDLSEMQNGTYRADLASGGAALPAIQGYAADDHLGAVRLLKDASAAYFGDGVATVHPAGNLPVLFGNQIWNHDLSAYRDLTTQGYANGDSINFLAYRMPYRSSYAPADLTEIPLAFRDRYFQKLEPYAGDALFTSAGGYSDYSVTSPEYQIARYRYGITWDMVKAGLEAQVTALADNHASVGSFALIHFKTEGAFERLVRDGIAPAASELWSTALYQYDGVQGEASFLEAANALDDRGQANALAGQYFDSPSNPVVRPSVTVISHLSSVKKVGTPANLVWQSELTANDAGGAFNTQTRFMSISGVYYALPRTQRVLDSGSPSAIGDNYGFKIESRFDDPNSPDPFSWPFYAFERSKGAATAHRGESNAFSFAPLSISVADFTSSDNVTTVAGTGIAPYTPLADALVTTQLLEIDFDALAAAKGGLTTTSTLSFSLGFKPDGDTGIPVLSSEPRIMLNIRDPQRHDESLGLSVQCDSQADDTGGAAFDLLYHSSRLLSLLSYAQSEGKTGTHYLHFKFANHTAADELAFAIYRAEPTTNTAVGTYGYKVYQTLDLLQDNGVTYLEEVSGQLSRDGVTNYPSDYPVYRPSVLNAAYTNPNQKANASFLGIIPSASKTYSGVENQGDMYVIELIDPAMGAGQLDLAVEASDGGTQQGYVDVGASPSFFYALRDDDKTTSSTGVSTLRYQNEALEIYPSVGETPPEYGNFMKTEDGGIAILPNRLGYGSAPWDKTPYFPLPSCFTARKDTQERFLDEMYRILSGFDGFGADQSPLAGTGVGVAPSFISLPVRDDIPVNVTSYSPLVLNTPNHNESGWVRYGYHHFPIKSLPTPELQVAGLPRLDNTRGASATGRPSRGMLRVPNIDYETDHRPSDTIGDLGNLGDNGGSKIQPDYSSPFGDPNIILPYTRAFDLAFSRSGTAESVAGTTRFKIRVIGLTFDELSDSDIPWKLFVKIPGLTVWMNAAYADGNGDKQDANNDGAGCYISHEDKVLISEGIVCTDILIDTAPAVVTLNGYSEAPILVQVRYYHEKHGNYSFEPLDWEDGFAATDGARVPSYARRGFLGVEVLRASNGENFDGDQTRAYPLA